MTPKWKLGSELSKVEQAHLLRAFVYRFTGEHKPSWVTTHELQFATDQQWLENTSFMVTKTGKLDKRSKWCHSNPVWPNRSAVA